MRRSSWWRAAVLLFLLAAWAAAVADMALMPWLQVRYAQPSLAAAWTIALALHFGSWAGLAWAALTGLLLDMLAAHPVGILTLPLMLVGYAAGWAHRTVLSSRFLVPFLAGGLGALMYGILQIPVARLWGYVAPWTMWLQEGTLLGAAYTGGVTWLTLVILNYIHPRVPDERLWRVRR